MVFIGGIGKQDAAPTEDKAYLEFARAPIDPIIYEHLRDAKPIGKALGYRQADNEDYRWSTTEGPPMPPASRITHAYVDYVFDMALIHPDVGALLIEVGQMLEPVTSLFAPRILLHVLSRMLRGEKPSAWGKAAAFSAGESATVAG